MVYAKQSAYHVRQMIKRLFLYFMLYSTLGWVYEVFLEVVVYQWGFTNRGVLFGPYCPVYGVGALLFIVMVYPLIKGKSLKHRLLMIPVVFLLCMLTATTLELITSYILEAFTGSWPWQTYADYKINFQARIALSPSVRFGLGGLLFLYILQPVFERITTKTTDRIVPCLGIILIVDILRMIWSTFS